MNSVVGDEKGKLYNYADINQSIPPAYSLLTETYPGLISRLIRLLAVKRWLMQKNTVLLV